MNILMFAASLYRRLSGAHPKTRERVGAIVREACESGAIPLGIAKDAVGDDAYWWLVHDRSRFASEAALMDHLERRSPRGYKVAVLRL